MRTDVSPWKPDRQETRVVCSEGGHTRAQQTQDLVPALSISPVNLYKFIAFPLTLLHSAHHGPQLCSISPGKGRRAFAWALPPSSLLASPIPHPHCPMNLLSFTLRPGFPETVTTAGSAVCSPVWRVGVGHLGRAGTSSGFSEDSVCG